MSRMYPTLEDMRVDQLQTVQANHERAVSGAPPAYAAQPSAPAGHQPFVPAISGAALYPMLDEYMGMQLAQQQQIMQQQQHGEGMQVAHLQGNAVGVRQTAQGTMQVAPVTGNSIGLARAEIKGGIREVILCKDADGVIGLRIRHVNKGVFVAFVQNGMPAALAGLRFGDQILQINGQTVAGWDNDKVHKFLKKADGGRIEMAVRDRPFERTVSMQKDSAGHIGFIYKNGKITALVKDSSAARNGLLTEHQLIEIGGQNVVGLKDKEIGEIIDASGRTVTVTVIPCVMYDHIVKCMGNSIIKRLMDHSIPDL